MNADIGDLEYWATYNLLAAEVERSNRGEDALERPVIAAYFAQWTELRMLPVTVLNAPLMERLT